MDSRTLRHSLHRSSFVHRACARLRGESSAATVSTISSSNFDAAAITGVNISRLSAGLNAFLIRRGVKTLMCVRVSVAPPPVSPDHDLWLGIDCEDAARNLGFVPIYSVAVALIT